jgi:Fe-S cluster assembly protein SufB
MPKNEVVQGLGLDEYKYHFVDEEQHVFRTQPGLREEVVRQISAQKDEPVWMLEFRLKALEIYASKPMPKWGGNLEDLDKVLDEIYFYVRPQDQMEHSWDDVPENIKTTFEKLGIPEAEQKILAGVGAQYESEMVYHSLKKEWEDKGVIFDSIEEGLKNHPELFRKYFGTVVPPQDNKFAAMNSAVWSGGSFVYIPKGVELETPLQAYFRVNQEKMGQFERTLIIADEGSHAHYIEGCTAPVYTTESFHSGVIEIIVNRDARFRYTTIQNWSNNMYNLVTQRAMVHENASMERVPMERSSPSPTQATDSIRTRGGKSFTPPLAPPLPSSPSRYPEGRGEQPTGGSARSTKVRPTPSPTWSATLFSSTRPPGPTPTPTSRSRSGTLT